MHVVVAIAFTIASPPSAATPLSEASLLGLSVEVNVFHFSVVVNVDFVYDFHAILL